MSISSFVGQLGNYGQSNYAATKGGLIAWTKTVAYEVARYGVTVNCICPGFTDTDMLRGVSDDVREKLRARIPLGRFGDLRRGRAGGGVPGARRRLHHRQLSQHQRRDLHVSIEVGESGEREFAVTDAVLEHFAEACGDRNPLHFDDDYAAGTRFGGRIAHGMLTAGFISSVLGQRSARPGNGLSGPGDRLQGARSPGDTVRVRVELVELSERGRAVFATTAWVGETLVADGRATVLLPRM